MQSINDLLTNFKQFPGFIGSNLTYLQSYSYYADYLTILDYEDNSGSFWRVYFFEQPLTRDSLGILFDYIAAEVNHETIKHRIVCAPDLNKQYQTLLESFYFTCFDVNEQSPWQQRENSAEINISHGRTYEDELIMFGEDLLQKDLNTSWSDFSLLFSDQIVRKESKEGGAEQQRYFHVYFRDRLYDEGRLRVVYKQGERKLKCPQTVHLELIGIENREETLFLTTLPLLPAIDQKAGHLFVHIPFDSNRIADSDLQRMERILKKWELDTFDIMSLQDYTITELRTFVQKITAITLLQGAAVSG